MSLRGVEEENSKKNLRNISSSTPRSELTDYGKDNFTWIEVRVSN